MIRNDNVFLLLKITYHQTNLQFIVTINKTHYIAKTNSLKAVKQSENNVYYSFICVIIMNIQYAYLATVVILFFFENVRTDRRTY